MKRNKWKLEKIITKTLKKIWDKSPIKQKALILFSEDIYDNQRTYICNCCNQKFKWFDIEVDFIKDVPYKEDFNHQIERMFLGYKTITKNTNMEQEIKKNLQVLCLKCYKNKKQKEKEKRQKIDNLDLKESSVLSKEEIYILLEAVEGNNEEDIVNDIETDVDEQFFTNDNEEEQFFTNDNNDEQFFTNENDEDVVYDIGPISFD
jgi:hypothetical protein